MCLIVAVVLAYRGAEQAAVVATVLGLPLTLVLAAPGMLGSSKSHPQADDPLAAAADQLAVAVGGEWDREAELRGVNQRALPVSWRPAGGDCFEEWADIVDAGSRSAREGGTTGWAATADELAGVDDEICEVLDRIPTGRLVVLGSAGAGKTVLLIRLLQGLLRNRAPGDAVPVVVPLATWNPRRDDLRAWLLDRLSINYEGLRAPCLYGGVKMTLGQALLRDRKLLLILDGLDEIRPEWRAPALDRLNEILRDGERLVLACREEEYELAAQPSPDSGRSAWLSGAAGIVVQPLAREVVGKYLTRGSHGKHAQQRWAPVLDVLGEGTALAEALTTPLVVTLADAIYNSRDRTGSARQPAELLAFTTQRAVKEHLFEAFIETVYRRAPAFDDTPTPQVDHARRYLEFL